MKKLILAVLSVVLVLGMTACGGENNVDSSVNNNETVAVDLAVVLEQIKTDCALSESRSINADSLFDIYGISADLYKQAACCMVPTGVFPAEVLMFEAVDANALGNITDKLSLRLQEVKNQSQSYDAENYALAQQCAVKTAGNIVVLFISADAATMNAILDSYLK